MSPSSCEILHVVVDSVIVSGVRDARLPPPPPEHNPPPPGPPQRLLGRRRRHGGLQLQGPGDGWMLGVQRSCEWRRPALLMGPAGCRG